MQLELGQLDLRYADLRIRDVARERRLVASLLECKLMLPAHLGAVHGRLAARAWFGAVQRQYDRVLSVVVRRRNRSIVLFVAAAEAVLVWSS